MNLLRDMWDDAPWLVVLLALLLAGVVFVIAATVSSERRWRSYRDAHHCRAIGERPAPPIYTMVGKVMVPIPQTDTLWRCDGGEELWR